MTMRRAELFVPNDKQITRNVRAGWLTQIY